MATTIQKLVLIAYDVNFQNRVKYAMELAAIAIMNELSTVTGHATRVTYAKLILNGAASILEQTIGVLTNSTIAAVANPELPPDWAISDSDIQFQVDSQFNAYAGIAN